MYESEKTPTYHSPSKIGSYWYGLTQQEREAKCPRFMAAHSKGTTRTGYPARVGMLKNPSRLPTDPILLEPGTETLAYNTVSAAIWRAKADRKIEQKCLDLLDGMKTQPEFVLLSVIQTRFGFRSRREAEAFLKRHPEIDQKRESKRRHINLSQFVAARLRETPHDPSPEEIRRKTANLRLPTPNSMRPLIRPL